MGHSLCSKKGYDVKSYGTGSVIKLPGAGPNQPNVYEFGTSYEQIYQDLTSKDQQLYLEKKIFFKNHAVANDVAAVCSCSVIWRTFNGSFAKHAFCRKCP